MTDDFRATFDGVDITEYVNCEDVQRAIESAGQEAARKIYTQWMASIGFSVTPFDTTMHMRRPTDDELAEIAQVYAKSRKHDDTQP